MDGRGGNGRGGEKGKAGEEGRGGGEGGREERRGEEEGREEGRRGGEGRRGELRVLDHSSLGYKVGDMYEGFHIVDRVGRGGMG